MSIVSQNIKYLRRMNGLTQEQFSRRIGIKRSLVGAYEEARANPPLDKLKVIASCFGISVDSLIKQDVRKIRETPDLMSAFESQTRPLQNTSHISEIANDFLNRLQPVSDIPVPKPSVFPVYEIGNVAKEITLKSISTEPPFRKFQERSALVSPPMHQVREPNFQSKPALYFVSKALQNQYISYFHSVSFLENLPQISLPDFQHDTFRAFEAGDDFPLNDAIVIGKKIESWDEISDGNHYILVTQSNGFLYRRVYNQVKIKGTLLISSDLRNFSSFELSAKEVKEIWEAKGFISRQLPKPSLAIGRVEELLDELKHEFDRVKKSK